MNIGLSRPESERLKYYVESVLLAEQLPPVPCHVTWLVEHFSKLVRLSRDGKPVVHRKRKTLSLLFDVFALQSEMSIDFPDELILGYTQSMMGFILLKPNPDRIGMIGLGGGSLVKYCCRHLPDSTLRVAEIDPRVIALRERFRVPQDSSQLQVLCIDGADFVQAAHDYFDVLLIDGFDKNGQPMQLCSQEFYDDCFRSLSDNGIAVVNLMGDFQDTDIYVERMEKAFGGAVIVFDSPDSLNRIVFACKGDLLDVDESILQSRISESEALPPMLLAYIAENILRQTGAKAEVSNPIFHV